MSILKIGITGGIGSGKTRVCRIFSSLGYEVYYADERAKWLMVNDPGLIAGVKDLFGEEAYLPDGALNRKFIGQIAFSDPGVLQQLNSIVHPVTGRDFEEWAKKVKADYAKAFVLKEAAILYESGAYLKSDGVITVYAPKSVRISRVIQRDSTSPEAVLQRMDKQWPESEKMFRSDFMIINDGNHPLTTQVASAIRFFERMAQGKTTPG